MKEFQSRSQGALGVVFVRDRIAEIHDDAIALKLRNEAAEPLHNRQGEVLIAALEQSKVFGIKPLGERRCSQPDR